MDVMRKNRWRMLEIWIPRVGLFICISGFLYGNSMGLIYNSNYTFDKWFNGIYLLGTLAFYLFLKECIVWCKAFRKIL